MEKQVISHAVLMEEVNKSVMILKTVGVIFGICGFPMLFLMFVEPFVLLMVGMIVAFGWFMVKKVKEHNEAIRTGNFIICESRVTEKYSRRRNKSRSYYLVFENGKRQTLNYHEYSAAYIGEARYVFEECVSHSIFKSYSVEKYILHEELAQNFEK